MLKRAKVTKIGEDKGVPPKNPRGGVTHHPRNGPPYRDKSSLKMTIEVIEKPGKIRITVKIRKKFEEENDNL